MASACCSPPDRLEACRFDERLEQREELVDRLDVPVALAPAVGADLRFSRTVRLGNTRRPSGTSAMPMPTRLCAGTWSTGSPSNSTWPDVGRCSAGDGAQQRGLAAAVGADDRRRSALLDRERDLEERLEVAVEDVDVLELEDDAHSGVPPM